jgi:lipoprotein NlpI
MPFLVEQPRSVRQRVKVVAPRRFSGNPPGPTGIGDKHFNLNTRYDVDANALTYTLSYERRADEVLPGDLAGFRERLQAARKLGGITLRLPLLDFDSLRSPLVELERRVQRTLGPENDSLREIVMRQEFERFFASEILKLAGDGSPLAGPLLERRAIANDMLSDFSATLADVDRALPLVKDDSELQVARGHALLSLGRADEAISAMQGTREPRNRAASARGVGNAQYYQGRFADAEQSFRLAVQDSSGDERSFGLLWLYLAAERNGRKGNAAISSYLGSVDGARWPGVLIHFVAGSASQDDVLREARREKRMERLNLAEAYFYVGQRLLLQGDTDGARRMFQRTVEIGAVPHREHALAQMELKRAPAH